MTLLVEETLLKSLEKIEAALVMTIETAQKMRTLLILIEEGTSLSEKAAQEREKAWKWCLIIEASRKMESTLAMTQKSWRALLEAKLVKMTITMAMTVVET